MKSSILTMLFVLGVMAAAKLLEPVGSIGALQATHNGILVARETALAGFECKEPKCGYTGTFPGGVFARGLIQTHESKTSTAAPSNTTPGTTEVVISTVIATSSSIDASTTLAVVSSSTSSFVQVSISSHTYGNNSSGATFTPSSLIFVNSSSFISSTAVVTSTPSSIGVSMTASSPVAELNATSTSTITLTSSITVTSTSTSYSSSTTPHWYTNSSSLSSSASSSAKGFLSSLSAVSTTKVSNSLTSAASSGHLAPPAYTVPSAGPAISPIVGHQQTVSSICTQSIVTITVTQTHPAASTPRTSSALGALGSQSTTTIYHSSVVVSTSILTSITVSVSRVWSYTIETHFPHTELPGPATASFSHRNTTSTSTALGVVSSTGVAAPSVRPALPVFTGGAKKKDAEVFGGFAFAVAFAGAALLI